MEKFAKCQVKIWNVERANRIAPNEETKCISKYYLAIGANMLGKSVNFVSNIWEKCTMLWVLWVLWIGREIERKQETEMMMTAGWVIFKHHSDRILHLMVEWNCAQYHCDYMNKMPSIQLFHLTNIIIFMSRKTFQRPFFCFFFFILLTIFYFSSFFILIPFYISQYFSFSSVV